MMSNTIEHNSESMLDKVDDSFVALWRSMADLWGISPTMAEIHGLLYIGGDALSMDDVMTRLGISRGNVSMNMNRLLEWGLVQRVHKRGDRRDYYESVGDVWEILTQIAVQRKRREIDPMLTTLRRCKETLESEMPAQSLSAEVEARSKRVEDMLTVLSWMDSLAQRFFESQRGLRQVMQILDHPEEVETTNS